MLLRFFNLFISLVSVLQVQIVSLNRYTLFLRRRRALSVCLNDRRTRQRRLLRPNIERRFWVRPGRTARWWDNLENQVVLAEEWRENFRMSRGSLHRLSAILRPHIEGQTTRMRELIWLCPSNGLKNCQGGLYSNHLGPEYITLPLTEPAVADLTSHFYQSYGIPQCIGAVDGTHRP